MLAYQKLEFTAALVACALATLILVLAGCGTDSAVPEGEVLGAADLADAWGGTAHLANDPVRSLEGLALRRLGDLGVVPRNPSAFRHHVGAVSVGIVDGEVVVDLCQREDTGADVDMNVVRTDAGNYVEVQGTAEKIPFSRGGLDTLLGLADAGTDQLFDLQRKTLGDLLEPLVRPSA